MPNLTAADQKLLGFVWQTFESVPKVNVKMLAEVGGYKTPASANSCWYCLKKKLFSGEGGSGGVVTKRSRVKKETGSREGDGPASSTPMKRRGRPSATVTHEQEDEVAGEHEQSVVKVKKEEVDDKLEAEAVQPTVSSCASSTEVRKSSAVPLEEDVEEGDATTAIVAEVEGCNTATTTMQTVKLEEQEVAKDFVEQMMKFV